MAKLYVESHFIYSYFGVGHMIKDREEICWLAARDLLYVHTTTFATPIVEFWLECEIAQWGYHRMHGVHS